MENDDFDILKFILGLFTGISIGMTVILKTPLILGKVFKNRDDNNE